MKYRKNPIMVDAWQWTGQTMGDAQKFYKKNGLPNWSMASIGGRTGLLIRTLEGDILCERGDWIIRGIAGEFYPCKPGIFETMYERVFDE